VAEDFRSINVDSQRDDPRSMLSLCRALIALRRQRPALTLGGYASLDLVAAAEGCSVLGYRRDRGEDRVAVLLNLGAQAQRLSLPDALVGARVLLSTRLERSAQERVVAGAAFELAGDEGVILDVSGVSVTS
jgi:alpha-glucosidase